jgi:hypothetical protein
MKTITTLLLFSTTLVSNHPQQEHEVFMSSARVVHHSLQHKELIA